MDHLLMDHHHSADHRSVDQASRAVVADTLQEVEKLHKVLLK
jgi:hypothetical protein